MSELDEQIQNRREKRQRLEEAGIADLPEAVRLVVDNLDLGDIVGASTC